MALPAGITTCTVTKSPPKDILGGAGSIESASIHADRDVVWSATGETLYGVGDIPLTLVGDGLSFQLAHVDQSGFLDANTGEAVTNWYFTVSVTVRYGSTRQVDEYRLQVVVGQDELDLDTIERKGTVLPAVTAPSPRVLSFLGLTGAITGEDIVSPLGETLDPTFAEIITNPAVGPLTGAALNGAIAAAGADLFTQFGIFENFKPELFRRFQAAVAAARAGLAPCYINVLGDSNAAGYLAGINADNRRSYGARALSLLDDPALPSDWGIIWSRIGYASGTTWAKPDDRYSLGAGWAQLNNVAYGPAGAGAVQGSGPTAGPLKFIADWDVDSFDIYFARNSAGPSSVTISIDGSAPSPTVLVADDFNGRSGSVVNTITMPDVGPNPFLVNTGGGAWSFDGTALAYSNLATTSSANTTILAVDAGSADATYSIVTGGDKYERMILRFVDRDNYIFVGCDGAGNYKLFTFIAHVATQIATSSTVKVSGDLISVTCNGTAIAVKVNGVQIMTATTSQFQTATAFGYANANPIAGSGTVDDLSITSNAFVPPDLSGSDAVVKVTATAASLGQHLLEITVPGAGACTVLGIEAYDSRSPGLRWNISGLLSGKASHYNASAPAPWGSQNLLYNVAGAALTIINLMINSHNASESIATYLASMGTMIDAVKAGGSDVILLASPDGGNPGSVPWSQYLDALRSLAASKGCGLINGQARWLPYAQASAAPYELWHDVDHPSPAGYWDLGQALAEGVRLALGRTN